MLGFYQIGFADPEPPETAPRELTAADPLSPTGPADMAPGDKRALHELLPYSGRRTQGGAKDDVCMPLGREDPNVGLWRPVVGMW